MSSFANGVLTITLARGGNVTEATRLERTSARAAGDDHGDHTTPAPTTPATVTPAAGPTTPATTCALTVGRKVREAELKTRAGEAVRKPVTL